MDSDSSQPLVVAPGNVGVTASHARSESTASHSSVLSLASADDPDDISTEFYVENARTALSAYAHQLDEEYGQYHLGRALEGMLEHAYPGDGVRYAARAIRIASTTGSFERCAGELVQLTKEWVDMILKPSE